MLQVNQAWLFFIDCKKLDVSNIDVPVLKSKTYLSNYHIVWGFASRPIFLLFSTRGITENVQSYQSMTCRSLALTDIDTGLKSQGRIFVLLKNFRSITKSSASVTFRYWRFRKKKADDREVPTVEFRIISISFLVWRDTCSLTCVAILINQKFFHETC